MASSSSASSTSTVAILSKGTPDSVIVVIWTIVLFFLEIIKRGSYVPNNWGPLIKAKQGINGAILNNGLFISDFITDIWIALLPILHIVRLNMSRTKRLTVIGVLLHGAMSFCAAIVRVVFKVQIVNAGLAKKTDVNMGLTTLMYWSMVEAGLSPITSNLPYVCSFVVQSECIPTIDLLKSS